MIDNYDTIRQQIDSKGYCVVPNVIDPATVDRASNALHDLLAAERTEATNQARTQRVGRLLVKHPVFTELLCHPFVVNAWKRWLGEDIICSSWSGNTVFPVHESISWHVDYPYWSKQAPWPIDLQAGQTVWLLDDFTDANGATGVVPGSHTKGHPPDGSPNQWRDEGLPLTGTKGSVVLAHGAWWHTARPNRTDASRSCLLGMYIMPWFLPQENMGTQLDELENPSELVTQLLGGNQHHPNTVGG